MSDFAVALQSIGDAELVRRANRLSPRERMILLRVLGLNGHPPETQAALARELDLSPQRIFQIKQEAIQGLLENDTLIPDLPHETAARSEFQARFTLLGRRSHGPRADAIVESLGSLASSLSVNDFRAVLESDLTTARRLARDSSFEITKYPGFRTSLRFAAKRVEKAFDRCVLVTAYANELAMDKAEERHGRAMAKVLGDDTNAVGAAVKSFWMRCTAGQFGDIRHTSSIMELTAPDEPANNAFVSGVSAVTASRVRGL